jgi:hypothetical protein
MDGPCGMFPARSTAKVFSGHQYTPRVQILVQYKIRLGLVVFVKPPVSEKVLAKSFPGGGLQEPGGDDLIGIHILTLGRGMAVERMVLNLSMDMDRVLYSVI